MTEVMAILNATPDSYFPDSRINIDTLKLKEIAYKIQKLEQEGADIFDIGGESTRPGSDPVMCDEELRRVIPLLECTASISKKSISIDTMKAKVAKIAIEKGATIINDVSGLKDQDMRKLLQEHEEVQAVLMHMRGTPKTMQQNPQYEKGVVEEVYDFFAYNLEALEKEGISRSRIILDPGIGFGKSLEDNLNLMRYAHKFHAFGCKLLYGISRKSWLQKFLGRPVEERLPGTISASLSLINQGVQILRVHDVQAHYDAIQVHHGLHTASKS